MRNEPLKERQASVRGACLSHILDRLLLAALLAAVGLFILWPLVCIVRQSFTITDGGFGLDAYRSAFRDHWDLVRNSVFTGLLSALCSTALGAAVGLCVRFAGKRVRGALTGLLLVSMVSPPFIAALSYIQLFGRSGLITRHLLGLSLNPYGWQGVVMMQSLFFASLNALLLISVLDRLDVSLLQASADLGAGSGGTVRRVILPAIRPSLLVCFLLSFIRSLADFGTPIVIGGRFETVATEIYMQIIGYADLTQSAALNVLLLIPALAVFWVYRRLMGQNDRILAGSVNKTAAGEERFKLRGAAACAVYPAAGLFFTMMALEYGSIFFNSFMKNRKGTYVFTTEYLQALLERNMDTFLRSVGYALIVAAVGTLLGVLISYYTERRRIPLGGWLDFIVTMPYMLPGSCFGIGYILAFHRGPLKLTGTALIVIANMIFKQLSITTKASAAALAQISTDVDDAARDLGAGRLRVLADVLLPNLKNAFSAGFIHNFTSAMITAGSVIFLVTPGKKIAVFTLFDSINTGRYGEASMIASFIILITVAVDVVFSRLLMGGGKRRGGNVSVS